MATSRGVTAGDVAIGFLTAFLFTPTHSGAVCAQPGQSAYVAPVDTEAVIAHILIPAASYGGAIACAGDECKARWERAQLWLVNHSAMKIQLATDVLLETYNSDRLAYGFTVTKTPLQSGTYAISISPSCYSAQYNIACHPAEQSVRRAFGYYVATGTDLLTSAPATDGIR